MSTPLFRSARREPTMLKLIAAGLTAVAIWQLGSAALIHAKALLAPMLIERAWEKSLAEHATIKPWPWADTWPVAKLEVPSMDITQYVLDGANGGTGPDDPRHLRVNLGAASIVASSRHGATVPSRDRPQSDPRRPDTELRSPSEWPYLRGPWPLAGPPRVGDTQSCVRRCLVGVTRGFRDSFRTAVCVPQLQTRKPLRFT